MKTCLLLVFVLVSTVYAQFTLPYSYTVDSRSGYFISWGFNADSSIVTFQVILYDEAWVGICFHNGTETGMTNGDFIVASFTTNGELVSVDDRTGPGKDEPQLDSTIPNCQDNLISRSASQLVFEGSTQTIMTFQRALNTNDPCDCPITNGTMNFAYAFGTSNEWDFHGPNFGSFRLNLFDSAHLSGNYTAPIGLGFSLQGLHGTLMTFAFGFLMTLGVFLPRYMKQFWWWFPLHIIIQLVAVTTSLVGFGIAIFMVDSQFGSWHSYFGAITLLLAFVSPFIGTTSHFMWKPSRERIPIFPDVLHWWIARIALLLSYCTIFLGLYFLRMPFEYFLGFALLLVSYALVFFFLDVINIREIGARNYFSLNQNPHEHKFEGPE